jgi:hypothetical protein
VYVDGNCVLSKHRLDEYLYLVIGDGRVAVTGCIKCRITKELNVDGRSLRYFTV